MDSRIDLAKYFKKKGFIVGAEIGVADGRYSEILLRENPDSFLYCIDPWEEQRDRGRSKDHQFEAKEQAEKKLKNLNHLILHMTSIQASEKISDESLDYVFIDGDHSFDHAMTDIIIWSRKVRKGGIVSGHDYTHFTNSGVVEAVNKYTEIHRIELNLINRNNKNFKDDRQPCWWFVKK